MASAVAMSGGHLELFENAQAWDFFGWFIPFMVLFIALEALYSHANDLKLYSFNDTFVRYAFHLVLLSPTGPRRGG